MGPRDLSPWGQDELKHLVQESKKKQNKIAACFWDNYLFGLCAHACVHTNVPVRVHACRKGRSKLLIFMSFPAEVTVLVIIASSNTCIRHCTEHAQCFQK